MTELEASEKMSQFLRLTLYVWCGVVWLTRVEGSEIACTSLLVVQAG